MPPRLPEEVDILLRSDLQADRDAAWESFVASHSRLILHVARSVTRDADEAMDAYAWTLEHLRADGGRRLRGFSEGNGTLFTTWLVVVVRRLCLDFLRHARGRRPKTDRGTATDGWYELRRRLNDLVGEPLELDRLESAEADPSLAAEARERNAALCTAVASLAPADRLLLALRFEDGLSASEIARVMRFPSQFHVYRRLAKLMADLRAHLSAAGFDGAGP